MPGEYDQTALTFQFPDNWTLADESLDDWPKSVSVHSPDGAFIAFYAYQTDGNSQAEILTDALKSLRAEYDDVDVELVEEELQDYVLHGYDAHFYCLDFLVKAQLRVIAAGEYLYLVMTQAEDTAFTDLQMVFQAITVSMLQDQVTE